MERLERIFPFLWLRDSTTRAEVAAEIEAIARCGVNAFCVESRIFSNFCRDPWWELMGFALAEAEKRGMQVWLLDDKRYPSGYANGGIAKRRALRQRHIFLKRVDVSGPKLLAKFLLRERGSDPADRLVGAYLVPCADEGHDFSRAEDVSAGVRGDFLFAEIPEGYYSLFLLVEGYGGTEIPDHVDPMNPASVQVLVDEVYEPHYRRFGRYFGKTFVGFFSDEPRLGNGVYDSFLTSVNIYQCTLGLPGMSYPFSADLQEELKNCGVSVRDLFALWMNVGDRTAEIRCRYMDAVTERYAKNFPQALSEWCHAHGAAYTGHVIEDLGCHARLGSGTGHYFRSMRGADFASMDIVLHQLRRGYETQPYYAPLAGGFSRPAFFSHTLPKLTSSEGRLSPGKRGNALCEVFGAFGWGESVGDMRFMINTLLSGGINAFLPHAFSPGFPNEDCPPHFYAGGCYPGFDGFSALMRYAAEMCGFLSGGRARIRVALLYHAEAEWSGCGYGEIDPVCAFLRQNQIDFDIVPSERIAEGRMTADQSFSIGEIAYRAVVLPYAEYRSDRVKEALSRVDGALLFPLAPQRWEEGLLSFLRARLPEECRLETPDAAIRLYRYEKAGRDLLFAYNTAKRPCKNAIVAPGVSSAVCRRASGEREGSGCAERIPLELDGEEAVLFFLNESAPFARSEEKTRAETVSCFRIYRKAYDRPAFSLWKTGVCADVNAECPEFSGKLRYECPAEGARRAEIAFTGEYLKLWDGKEERVFLSSPCSAALYGVRTLRLETANTLSFALKDFYSRYSALESAGISEVKLFYGEKNE